MVGAQRPHENLSDAWNRLLHSWRASILFPLNTIRLFAALLTESGKAFESTPGGEPRRLRVVAKAADHWNAGATMTLGLKASDGV
jgi:hypothetical protein